MSLAQEVKDKIDIAEVMRGYVKLNPAGRNFKVLCPFHREKTPSLIVSPERQSWRCFGCGKGGDAISFLMEFENIEFMDALKELAERAGIKLEGRLRGAARGEYDALYELTDFAVSFYEKALAANDEARQYLAGRGLKDETAQEFRVGFASDRFDALVKAISAKGFRIQDAETAGLVIKAKTGMYVDRFRGRIMFPIMSHMGKPIGFSGRILPSVEAALKAKGQEMGKYMNSPETPIFKKSRILYGFYRSKMGVRKEDKAYMVEGQMDFLFAWQDGIPFVVATSGTALTEDHLKTLRNYTENLILGFDNDKAGAMAAERSIDMANALDFNVRLVSYGEHKDAADMVVASPGLLAKKLAEETGTAMDFYFNRYLGTSPDGVERKKAVRAILGKVRLLSSAVEQASWMAALSAKTGIAEHYLLDEMRSMFSGGAPASPAQVGSANSAVNTAVAGQQLSKDRKLRRIELIAETLLALAFSEAEFLSKLEPHLIYIPEQYHAVYHVRVRGSGGAKEATGVLSEEALAQLELRATYERGEKTREEIAQEIEMLVYHLRLEWLRERMNALAEQVRQAESKKEPETTQKVLEDFHAVSRELAAAKANPPAPSFNNRKLSDTIKDKR